MQTSSPELSAVQRTGRTGDHNTQGPFTVDSGHSLQVGFTNPAISITREGEVGYTSLQRQLHE